MDEQTKVEKMEKKIEIDRRRMAIPGLYVDTFSTLQWKDHVRITFGETGINGESAWRAAIVIEKDLMKRLSNRLIEIIKEQEQKQDEDEA